MKLLFYKWDFLDVVDCSKRFQYGLKNDFLDYDIAYSVVCTLLLIPNIDTIKFGSFEAMEMPNKNLTNIKKSSIKKKKSQQHKTNSNI